LYGDTSERFPDFSDEIVVVSIKPVDVSSSSIVAGCVTSPELMTSVDTSTELTASSVVPVTVFVGSVS